MELHRSIAYLKQVLPGDGPVDVPLAPGDRPVSINYLKDVSIFFLIDEGDRYSYVQEKHLSSSGHTEEELLNWGIENLHGMLDKIQISKNEGVLYFHGSGDFEASLLLVPELWEPGLTEHCPNGFAAAIPARDILVVCDRKDSAGIDKLGTVVEKVWPCGDHLLTKVLLTRNDGSWLPLSNA